MKRMVLVVFISLCVLFLVYTTGIFLQPLNMPSSLKFNSDKASRGRLVWQNNNCQSCHQLYGLGGYLGPDLTNIISNPMKGEGIIKPMVEAGNLQMPAFKLPENEMADLIEFLKSTDASGNADPRNFKSDTYGMTSGK